MGTATLWHSVLSLAVFPFNGFAVYNYGFAVGKQPF